MINPPNYIQQPNEIYKQSFSIIQQKLNAYDLNHFTLDEQRVLIRMIHTCANVDYVVKNTRFSPTAVQAATNALGQKTSILCDTRMVCYGLLKPIQRFAKCIINEPHIHEDAKKKNITRAMASMHHWKQEMKHSILLVGNAPSALFCVLEHLSIYKPKLIIGIPVGFVGAAESKKQLLDHADALNIPCITLLGDQGGSALAASVVNALWLLAHPSNTTR